MPAVTCRCGVSQAMHVQEVDQDKGMRSTEQGTPHQHLQELAAQLYKLRQSRRLVSAGPAQEGLALQSFLDTLPCERQA